MLDGKGRFVEHWQPDSGSLRIVAEALHFRARENGLHNPTCLRRLKLADLNLDDRYAGIVTA
jgi:hypothetical protein